MCDVLWVVQDLGVSLLRLNLGEGHRVAEHLPGCGLCQLPIDNSDEVEIVVDEVVLDTEVRVV